MGQLGAVARVGLMRAVERVHLHIDVVLRGVLASAAVSAKVVLSGAVGSANAVAAVGYKSVWLADSGPTASGGGIAVGGLGSGLAGFVAVVGSQGSLAQDLK